MNNETYMTNEVKIQVKATDEALAGKYANMMNISHTPEEFILDFLSVVPAVQTATLTARIITSPGHLKRIVQALNENIKLYEQNVGKIQTSQEPDQKMGF